MSKIKYALNWVLTVILFLCCIAAGFSYSGVLFFIAGILVLPPASKLMFGKISFYDVKIKWSVLAVLVVIAVIFFPRAGRISDKAVTPIDSALSDIATESESAVTKTADTVKTDTEAVDKDRELAAESRRLAEESLRLESEAESRRLADESSKLASEAESRRLAEESSRAEAARLAEESIRAAEAEAESRRQAEEAAQREAAEQAGLNGEPGANENTGQTVYVTPTGKRYHLDPDCGGKNSTPATLDAALARGLTPCKKCAK